MPSFVAIVVCGIGIDDEVAIRKTLRQDLELAVSDLGIQLVHTSGVNLDQHVILPSSGSGISPARTQSALP